MLTMTARDESSHHRIIFGIIATSSFFGNLFFALLILRSRRHMLKTAYDMMVLNLVITDMLTGVFLVLTPNFIIGSERFPWVTGDGGAVYCYLVENQYLVFTLGIVSLYTAALMAIERWVAVFRVLVYKTLFQLKRVRVYLFVVWLGSFAANSPHIIELQYARDSSESSGVVEQCVVYPLMGDTSRKIVGVVEVLLKFLIPSLIMFVTFTRLYVFMKRSATCPIRARSQLVLRRLTRMAAATAFLMALCWMPNQLYYLLFKFNLVELNTRWHLATVILCMANSCLNPYVFLLSNKVYRGVLRDMVCRCGPCGRGKAILHGVEPPKERVASVKFRKSSELRVFDQSEGKEVGAHGRRVRHVEGRATSYDRDTIHPT